MPIIFGTHRNGQSFARINLIGRGYEAKIEGVANDQGGAVEALRFALRTLADDADDAWSNMGLETTD